MNNVTSAQLARFLDEELYRHVIPFWLRHAVDQEHGGLLTCLDENGNVLSTDKYVWSQTRALWVFSTLALRTSETRYRTLAEALFTFCAGHGRNERGEWVFRLSREGDVLQGADSIYTDGFAIMGLAAYWTLTRSPHAAALLRETCESVRSRLVRPGSYGTKPYDLPPGTRVHAVEMLFSMAFWEAGRTLEDESLIAESIKHAMDILDHFMSDEDHAIREFLDLDNRPLPGTIGTCCLPGHAFESMWTLIRIFRSIGRMDLVDRCVEILHWHLEKGWDSDSGGIFLAIDLAGQPPYWPFADYKPWWPQVEGMYAALLAYAETRKPWSLPWYARLHNYAFTHYPVRPDGEWYNRLDRQGKPVTDVIALPVKDPFHLPRALMFMHDTLESLPAGTEIPDLLIG